MIQTIGFIVVAYAMCRMAQIAFGVFDFEKEIPWNKWMEFAICVFGFAVLGILTIVLIGNGVDLQNSLGEF
jgi:hypothetical protein